MLLPAAMSLRSKLWERIIHDEPYQQLQIMGQVKLKTLAISVKTMLLVDVRYSCSKVTGLASLVKSSIANFTSI